MAFTMGFHGVEGKAADIQAHKQTCIIILYAAVFRVLGARGSSGGVGTPW